MIYYIQYTKTAEKQENIEDLKFDISSFIGRDLLCARVPYILSTIRIFKNLWNILVLASNVLFHQENIISETTSAKLIQSAFLI